MPAERITEEEHGEREVANVAGTLCEWGMARTRGENEETYRAMARPPQGSGAAHRPG